MLQPTVKKVEPLEDYNLYLEFDNGEKKVFNVKPYISGDWYGKLSDARFFSTVRANGYCVEWADGQDIAPHERYDDSVPVDLSRTSN